MFGVLPRTRGSWSEPPWVETVLRGPGRPPQRLSVQFRARCDEPLGFAHAKATRITLEILTRDRARPRRIATAGTRHRAQERRVLTASVAGMPALEAGKRTL